MKYVPHDYQAYCIQRVVEDPAVGLFLRPGLGKTVITLSAVNILKYFRWQVQKVLVVAPKKVAEATWSKEAAKWDHLQHLRTSVVLGSATKRIKALNTPADIYVINRENVEWLVDYYKQAWPFDMVVLDESTSFKNSQSKRWKAMRRVRRFIKRMVLLTGTPSSKGLIDLWAQVYLLDCGERLGQSLSAYRERYFDPDQRSRTQIFSYKAKDGAESAVLDAISDICISMKAEDYLELPDFIQHEVPVLLDAKARRAYHAVVNLLSIGFGVLTGNTAAASAAVFTFNSALLASPITWIIMLIAVVIGLLYGVVAIINKVTGSSISATGLICGAIAVAGAFIGNTVIGLLNALIQYIWAIFVAPFLGIVEWILNVCNGGFNSFGDAVANLIGQIIGWFLNLGKVVTTIIDAIFGTNWTAGLESLQSSVTAWGKNENAITLDKNAPTVDYRFEYGDAWAAGNDFGKGIDAKIGGMFNMGGLGDTSGFDLGDIAAYTGETADNTGKTADALAVTEEQLEYLRDIAERDAINRFTTAEVKIDMTGMTNRIDGSADLDGVISQLTEGFTEALVTAAEGVHA